MLVHWRPLTEDEFPLADPARATPRLPTPIATEPMGSSTLPSASRTPARMSRMEGGESTGLSTRATFGSFTGFKSSSNSFWRVVSMFVS
jgi:hypothetical protein